MKPLTFLLAALVIMLCIGAGCKKKTQDNTPEIPLQKNTPKMPRDTSSNAALVDSVAGNYKIHCIITTVSLMVADTGNFAYYDTTITGNYTDTMKVSPVNDSVISIDIPNTAGYLYTYSAVATPAYTFNCYSTNFPTITVVFYKNYPDSVSVSCVNHYTWLITDYWTFSGRKM